MEKSIEERARRYGLESASLLCLEEWTEAQKAKKAKVYAKVYSNIATEQKKIDIDKACELFRNECQEANGLIKSVCDRNIGDLINVDASVKTFRKKLEE